MTKTRKNRAGRTDLQMDSNTFRLRREVMVMLYEARELVQDLPRVEVRIVENVGSVLGTATLGGAKHISIMQGTCHRDEAMLRHVVFHELVHTLFGVEHIESCPLMKAIVDKPVTKAQAHQLFRKYAKVKTMGCVA